MKAILNLLFLSLLSWSVWAESSHYSIQVVSAQSPNLADYSLLSEFGSIYTEHVNNNTVRVKVGSYFKREEAEMALKKIRKQGFPDAFLSAYSEKITALPKKAPEPQITIKKTMPTEVPSALKQVKKPPSSRPSWSNLTPEQKRNVVYLDGILHLRVNDDFIPLSKKH